MQEDRSKVGVEQIEDLEAPSATQSEVTGGQPLIPGAGAHDGDQDPWGVTGAEPLNNPMDP